MLSPLPALAIALAGAFVGQLADVVDLRNTSGNLKRLKSVGLWIAVAFKMLAAAVLMLAYFAGGEHPGPWVSLTTGLSADVILKALTKGATSLPPPGSSDRDRKQIK